ncbi:hypothetical protein NDU88_001068 [Pleurodeles waltl]|uniref:Uncharacterized protein n=1 Tax=Pleurodeles waltl TaxID=8319 RepID=A0AAV7LAF1_PLEWA|nr:hypothetical protein NDU88_001068 [Pleurodeles waltl]
MSGPPRESGCDGVPERSPGDFKDRRPVTSRGRVWQAEKGKRRPPLAIGVPTGSPDVSGGSTGETWRIPALKDLLHPEDRGL